MRLIILAAGRGERLMPLTRNTPKPLLDIGNGNTLLEEQIARVRESGVVDEIVLVTGYLAEQVDAKLLAHQREGLRIRAVYNPFWKVSNNLCSMWLARHEMDRDFLVTNGDNLFAADVFRDLVAENTEGIALAVGAKREFDYDDMRVRLEDGLVARVSKQIDDEDAQAESPGLSLVRGERARAFFLERLEALVREPEGLGQFWLEVFNALWRDGVPVKPWWFDAAAKWQEVDVHIDIRRVQANLRIEAAGPDGRRGAATAPGADSTRGPGSRAPGMRYGPPLWLAPPMYTRGLNAPYAPLLKTVRA